jgi:hypothetical protein
VSDDPVSATSSRPFGRLDTNRGAAVALDELELGQKLGSGGQAVGVYLLQGDHTGQVFKRYKTSLRVNDVALDELIRWRKQLPAISRSALDLHVSWPRARVVDGGSTVGVLLSLAPKAFYRTDADAESLRDLQSLYLVDRMRRRGLEVPEPVDRLRITLQLVNLLGFFSNHGVVHGDLSMKNILWCPPKPGDERRPLIYLLDCDGAHFSGQDRPIPAVVTTPGWTDPRVQTQVVSAHDAQSDLYALSLAIERCYFGRHSDHGLGPVADLPDWPPVRDDFLQLLRSGLSPDDHRPPPDEWVPPIQSLIEELDDPASEIGKRYRNRPSETDSPAPPPLPPIRPPLKGKRRLQMPRPSRAVLAVLVGIVLGLVLSTLLLLAAQTFTGSDQGEPQSLPEVSDATRR